MENMSDLLRSSNPRIRLRIAVEEDTELILDFIRALGEYERLSHEVVADAETLRRSLNCAGTQ